MIWYYSHVMLEGRSVHKGCSKAIFTSANKEALDTEQVTTSPKYASLSKYGAISKHLFSLSEKGGITVSFFFFFNVNGELFSPLDRGTSLFSQEIILLSLCTILALLPQQKYSFRIF